MEKIKFSEFSKIYSNFSISLEEVSSIQQIKKIEENWENIVGPIFKNHSSPHKVKNKKLLIYVEHVSYKQELLFIKKPILKNIKLKLSLDIDSIDFRVGKLSFKKQDNSLKLKQIGANLVGKERLLEIIKKELDVNFQNRLRELIKFL